MPSRDQSRSFTDCIPLSPVVLYSPNGATRSVVDLAERMKEAIEVKAFERNGHQALEKGSVEGQFANGMLAYNVFIVTGMTQTFLS